MLNVLLCILILAVLATGAYFLAQYIVNLQYTHGKLVDEHNAAVDHIQRLEEDIRQLEFERNETISKQTKPNNDDGWSNFR